MREWLLLLCLVTACAEKGPSKACRDARESAGRFLSLHATQTERLELPEPTERWERRELSDDPAGKLVDEVQHAVNGLVADSMDAEIAARKSRNALRPEKIAAFDKAATTLRGTGSPAKDIAEVKAVIEKDRAIDKAFEKRILELSASLGELSKRVEAGLGTTIANEDTRDSLESQLEIIGNLRDVLRLQIDGSKLDRYTVVESTLASIDEVCGR